MLSRLAERLDAPTAAQNAVRHIELALEKSGRRTKRTRERRLPHWARGASTCAVPQSIRPQPNRKPGERASQTPDSTDSSVANSRATPRFKESDELVDPAWFDPQFRHRWISDTMPSDRASSTFSTE